MTTTNKYNSEPFQEQTKEFNCKKTFFLIEYFYISMYTVFTDDALYFLNPIWLTFDYNIHLEITNIFWKTKNKSTIKNLIVKITLDYFVKKNERKVKESCHF